MTINTIDPTKVYFIDESAEIPSGYVMVVIGGFALEGITDAQIATIEPITPNMIVWNSDRGRLEIKGSGGDWTALGDADIFSSWRG